MKQIAVKDLNLGDLVVGLHAEDDDISFSRIAGKITTISVKLGVVKYFVDGEVHYRPNGNISTSGFLLESEVQVIDQGACRKIIRSFREYTNLIETGALPYRETVEEVNDLIYDERQKLEKKYVVSESC
jgi:hypothetical protein